MTTPSSNIIFQKSAKPGTESIHNPERRRQSVAILRHGIFLPQFWCSLRKFSNFLPMTVDMDAGGQSALGLRFVLCHNGVAIEVQLQRKTAGTSGRIPATGQALRMTTTNGSGMTRRGLLGAFTATALIAAPTYSNAFGFLRGAGDIRRIRMYSGRTGESIDTIYWIEGKYINEAMAEVNHFMRDWRSGAKVNIDARTIDIMAAAHRLMDVSEPYMMLSGYRSPQTNAMLRSRSRGVAKDSLHVHGKAADLRLKSRSVGQMAKAAEACASGGVGRYSRSNFVHMDCGPVRSWGG